MTRTVERISYSQTKPFLLNVHYARRMPCITHAFGLFIDGILYGVCTFGVPASHSLCIGLAGKDNSRNVLELNRLVVCDYTPNNASFLVGNALRQLPNGTFVVSYADGGWGHVGYVYQATNFIYTGATKPRTDIYSEGHSRHYEKGEVRRVPRSSKHRYVYLVGDKRTRRTMKSQLRYPTLPYPKGESKRYDTENPTDLYGNNHATKDAPVNDLFIKLNA